MFGRFGATMALAAIAAASPACADQIIGYWCNPDSSQSIKVDYQNVVTPGGKTVDANIRRHHLDFTIPDGEPNAGARFSAEQYSDERIDVTIVGTDGTSNPAEIWRPCKPVS